MARKVGRERFKTGVKKGTLTLSKKDYRTLIPWRGGEKLSLARNTRGVLLVDGRRSQKGKNGSSAFGKTQQRLILRDSTSACCHDEGGGKIAASEGI